VTAPATPPGASAARRLGTGQTLALVAAFLALFAIVGFATYGLPFFYNFFVTDLGWTRKAVTSGNAYTKIAAALLFGLVAGVFVDAFGPRRLMLVGITFAGAAVFGLSSLTATSFGLFYFCYWLNALGYVFGGPLPNQVLLSRYFDKGRGRAMGFAYLGIGIGGAIVMQLIPLLIAELGWRGALRTLGVLMILVALPAAWFVREPPAEGRPPRSEGLARGIASSLREVPGFLGEMSRQPSFYLLALGSMASIGAVGGTMQNLKLYLSLDRGLSEAQAGNVGSTILIGSLVGRLLMGWLADVWPKKRVMLLIYTIVAASIPLVYLAPSGAGLTAAAFLFGIGLGGDYMIIPLMAAELFGLRRMGRVMGIVLTADSVAEAVVPMGVASIRDSAGSYGPGFGVLVVLALLGAIAVALLPRAAAARNEQEPAAA
jgi:sugar phosphate permease